MGDYLLVFLLVLLITGAFLSEDFIFAIVYLLAGSYVLGRWWTLRVLETLEVERRYEKHLFIGEKQTVQLVFKNPSWLPIAWLQVQESLPIELGVLEPYQRVISVPGRGTVEASYSLEARRRGYYSLGPLQVSSGDVFGVEDGANRTWEGEHITVYPRVIPLAKMPFPSSAPLGTLRHHQPIFEDPTRVMGKRDYVPGDSLRRMDWKSSAVVGRLQVKTYEPAISLEITICLDLNRDAYPSRRRFDVPELAIVTAASIAYYVTAQRQAVGLITNGCDPLHRAGRASSVPMRRGQSHLMRILELLARVEVRETAALADLVGRERVNLPWGSTMALITPQVDDALFGSLFAAQRTGLNIMLILTGPVAGVQNIRQRVNLSGIPLYHIQDEDDLNQWRREERRV